MIKIGLDFDNTLVRYDNLFHRLAVEKGFIDQSFPKNKLSIRNFFRENNIEREFTLLQGEVYGSRILEAEIADGMFETLMNFKSKNYSMVLISHKTKTPFLGPPYDLHKAAIDWLTEYNFFEKRGLNWDFNQVFFASTKIEKAELISQQKCSHYVDDLPEILDLLPTKVEKILYDPTQMHQLSSAQSTYKKVKHWSHIYELIVG